MSVCSFPNKWIKKRINCFYVFAFVKKSHCCVGFFTGGRYLQRVGQNIGRWMNSFEELEVLNTLQRRLLVQRISFLEFFARQKTRESPTKYSCTVWTAMGIVVQILVKAFIALCGVAWLPPLSKLKAPYTLFTDNWYALLYLFACNWFCSHLEERVTRRCVCFFPTWTEYIWKCIVEWVDETVHFAISSMLYSIFCTLLSATVCSTS